MKQLATLITLLFFALNTFSQNQRFNVYKANSNKRAVIRNNKNLSVYYENLAWNQKPNEVESGYMYLRDRQSGELIELKLIETEPNSNIFNMEIPRGILQQDRIAAEVYSAPQSMLNGNNRIEIMKKMIEDQTLKRKPFLLRVLRQKGQIVDVFDSKADALTAYNKYKEQMGLQANDKESDSIIEITNKEKPVKKKVIDTSTLQSLFLANESNMAATQAKNEELRAVLREVEAKRRKAALEKVSGLSSSEKSLNKKKAKKNIDKAVEYAKERKFNESMEAFLAASDLIAENEDAYEQFGLSLYRAQKYNHSVVVLEAANPSDKRLAEKEYYLGMNFYQLKEYENAIKHFDNVIALKQNTFTVSSYFYKGVTLIEMQKHQEAIASFQKVLDSSDNPEMDKRAEKYIEYALNRKKLDEKRANWLFFDGVLGLIYDSNIILANDQARDQGTITNEEGWRFLGQVTAKARPYYTEADELSIELDFTGIKSVDEDFTRNETVEQADPYIIGLSVPWTHRGTLKGKGYFFELAPGFETISMDLDGSGMGRITDSLKLNFDNTLVVNKNWIAKADMFLSSNDSSLPGDATGADSFATGFKISSIIILNKDLERYLIPEFGYQINNAKGEDYSFNRADLALTFTTSTFWSLMWNSRLGYYLANYESNRSDNNWTLTTGLSARLSANWTWNLTGSYIINDSNLNRYKKHNIATTFGFSY